MDPDPILLSSRASIEPHCFSETKAPNRSISAIGATFGNALDRRTNGWMDGWMDGFVLLRGARARTCLCV